MSRDADSTNLSQYRTISSLAVLSLVLGLASALSLVTPLLLVIALVGAIVAIVALRRIRANSEQLSGTSLTLAALFLCVFFLAFTPMRLWSRHQVLTGYSTQLGDAFLDLLQQGKLHEAHQLSQLKYVNLSPSETMGQLYMADDITAQDLSRFMEEEVIRQVLKTKSQFAYRLEAFEPTVGEPDREVLLMRYRIEPEPSLGQPAFPMYIAVSRSVDEKTKRPLWRINRVSHFNAKESRRT